MENWREHLNRIAVEFWCGVGNVAELPVLADAANNEMGEAHPSIWDLYTFPTQGQAKNILLKIAFDINGFKPESLEAESYSIRAFQKALNFFLAQEMTVQTFCKLVEVLDSTYIIGLPDIPRPESLRQDEFSLIGNLWNCCDWCDESWTFENSLSLLIEAQRVSEMLAIIVAKLDKSKMVPPLS